MEEGRRRNQRREKRGIGNQLAISGIILVVVMLAVVMHISASSLKEKDLEYQAKEAELEKTVAEEESRAEKLEEYRIYVQTKQYVEKVAKEKLGLVKKDEILLKPKEEK